MILFVAVYLNLLSIGWGQGLASPGPKPDWIKPLQSAQMQASFSAFKQRISRVSYTVIDQAPSPILRNIFFSHVEAQDMPLISNAWDATAHDGISEEQHLLAAAALASEIARDIFERAADHLPDKFKTGTDLSPTDAAALQKAVFEAAQCGCDIAPYLSPEHQKQWLQVQTALRQYKAAAWKKAALRIGAALGKTEPTVLLTQMPQGTWHALDDIFPYASPEQLVAQRAAHWVGSDDIGDLDAALNLLATARRYGITSGKLSLIDKRTRQLNVQSDSFNPSALHSDDVRSLAQSYDARIAQNHLDSSHERMRRHMYALAAMHRQGANHFWRTVGEVKIKAEALIYETSRTSDMSWITTIAAWLAAAVFFILHAANTIPIVVFFLIGLAAFYFATMADRRIKKILALNPVFERIEAAVAQYFPAAKM